MWRILQPFKGYARIDSLVAQYQQADAPGISLAVSIDGKVVYERWTGQADIAHGVPINGDTRFEIASVAKQFTAFAIVLLADEGKIALDDDVRAVIPELKPGAAPLTIRHLLNHTGGLREVNSLLLLTGRWESSPVTQARALDLVLRQRGANFSAGERQEYSNTGYLLLAEIVARVSGQPFPEFLHDRIFAPLGMDQRLHSTSPKHSSATGWSRSRPSASCLKPVPRLIAMSATTACLPASCFPCAVMATS
ncbi:beta-lactamase family protein [Erythrobacter sp. NFXS35]|uniref:serine hydrolase domain-containing protein n=1 Tax=Erythrobacter sp. NFXS35 TaxID=2818436 RepID=UPI0032DF9B78